MTMVGTLVLKGLRFHAYHGVGEQERLTGHDFTVSLSVEYDMTAAMAADSIADAVSYADIYAVVKREMAVPSNLLEHVAGRIAGAVRERFSQVRSVEIEIMKINPPISADADAFGVRVRFGD